MTTSQYYFRTLLLCFLAGLFLPVGWLFRVISLLILIAIFYRGELFIKYVRIIVPVLAIFSIGIAIVSANTFVALAGKLCDEFIPTVGQAVQVHEAPKAHMNASEKVIRQIVNINSRSLSRLVVFQGGSYCPGEQLDGILEKEGKKFVQASPIYIAGLVITHGISFAIFRSRKIESSSQIIGSNTPPAKPI